jgi:hypothetical protein
MTSKPPDTDTAAAPAAAPPSALPAVPAAELTDPAAYVELTFGAGMHARIWVGHDAPAAFTAILELARSMQPGPPSPRAFAAPGTIKKLIDAGLLAPGQTLTWYRRRKADAHQATVTADARLRLADGSVHATASGAAMYLAGHPVKGWHVFTTASGETLAQLIASLPGTPARPEPPAAPRPVSPGQPTP